MVVVVKTLNHTDDEVQADVLLTQVLRNAGHDCEIVVGNTVMGATKESVILLHLQVDSPVSASASGVKARSLRSHSIDMGTVVSGSQQAGRSRSAIELETALARKTREAKELDHNLKVALKSIKTFHRQQNELFEEFVALREKYDAHKLKLRQVLWDYVPDRLPGFDSVPPKATDILETDDEVGHWFAGKILGEGQFATVREVRDGPATLLASSGFLPGDLAIKRIVKDRVTDIRNMGRVNNEIRLLRDLNHPCIAQLVDVCHTEQYLYIVQEKGGLDLFEHYRMRPGPAEESFVQSVFSQLCSAVNYLFTHDVAHRDIKPENILVDAHGRVKLVDFGLSTYHCKRMTLDDFCGTPGFFAPEMLAESTYSSETLDVWSLGCVLLEMLLGHSRFAEVWMPAYAYENLHDAHEFDRELLRCLAAVKAVFSHQLSSKPSATTSGKNALARGARFDEEEEEKAGEDEAAVGARPGDDKQCEALALDGKMSTPQRTDLGSLASLKNGVEGSTSLKATNSAPELLAKTSKSANNARVRRSSEVYPHAIMHHVNFRSCVYAVEEQKTRSEECRDFLLALLTRNPQGRLKVSALTEHPFILASRPRGSASITDEKGGGSLGVMPARGSKSKNTRQAAKAPLKIATEQDPVHEDGLRDRLPPLSPASPKVEGMQELVKVGDDLLALHHLNLV